MSSDPQPTLRGGPVDGRAARAAVLVLHGGREHSHERTSRFQLSYVRMLDFSWGLRKAATHSAVYMLRYRVRGWNGEDGAPDPVTDTLWALGQVRERHPGKPIGLLGHSMGGRAAFAVAGQPDVTGVCALAPWLPAGEPLPPAGRDQRFVIAHGTSDRMTSSPLSKQYAERLRRDGRAVARFELPGARHALMDRPRLWHDFAVRTTLGLVGDGPLPRGVAEALDHQTPGPFDLELATFDGNGA